MIFSGVEIENGAIVDPPISSLSAQSTLVNGQYQPTLTIKPGEIQRWRMLNASVVFMRVQLEGQILHKLAVDGDTLERVSPEEIIEIQPGGRVDMLVQLDRPGT